MTTSDFAIETAGLTKAFGRKRVVDSLDLAVPRGSIYALLGRNGSGKTTTIRMLLGLLRPTDGSSRVLGCESRALTPAVRERIGYVASTHPLHDWMTVREVARCASQFHDAWNGPAFDSIMKHFAVRMHAQVKHLSLGERAGLSLAIAVAGEPDLLILDEPAGSLDPVARRSIMQQVFEVAFNAGRTVFLSSHQLEDVVDLADHVAVLDYSRLHVAGTLGELTESVRQYRLTFGPGGVPAALPEIRGVLSAKRADNELVLTVVRPDSALRAAIASMQPIRVTEGAVPPVHALLSYLASGAPDSAGAGGAS